MKASELMLGDYLQWNGMPFRVVQVSAPSLELGNKGGFILENGEEEGEPIPLSPEILDKNGFKWENGPYSRWCHAQVERKIITLYRSNTFYSIMINTDCHLPVLNNIQLHSVHELQHALRLCGIEKEIEL